MAELEEVDLSKALAMIGKRSPWLARDIFLGTDSIEQDTFMAEVFEHAARLLRERVKARSVVIDVGGRDPERPWGERQRSSGHL